MMIPRDDEGVILVEFAFVCIIFSMMLFGGFFVLSDLMAKNEGVSSATAAAEFAAAGGCTDTPHLQVCANGTLPKTCVPGDPSTAATICAIEAMVNQPFGTAPGSLQVSLACQDGCQRGHDLTVCVRSWSTWRYIAIISPMWVNSKATEILSRAVSFGSFFSPNTYNSTPPQTCP
jgi:hypothetical protein